MSSLHMQIMNLPCAPSEIPGVNSEFAYRVGHRDARHAAAELALTQDARVRRLEEALTLIAKTDAIDAALDPQRAIRVARAALKEPS